MKIKLPQFPPKPLTPLFPEQEIDIPDLPKPSGVTVGIPPSISVSFDINNGIHKYHSAARQIWRWQEVQK